MLFYKFKSQKQVNVNINKYLINWNESPSKQQKILQNFLYPYWKNKIVCAEFRIPGSLFRIDILNISDRLAIEYSPDSTHDFNPFFHNRASFERRVKSDIDKIEELERNKFKIIELNEEDLDLLSPRYFIDKFQISL
jgi:hypothetical protein